MTCRSLSILVTGAAGYIGSALADALRGHGRVVTLRRSPAAVPDTGLKTLQADVSRPFDLPALPRLDAVVYLVGADARTPHQAVVTALDALGQLGFRKVNIATAPEAQK